MWTIKVDGQILATARSAGRAWRKAKVEARQTGVPLRGAECTRSAVKRHKVRA